MRSMFFAALLAVAAPVAAQPAPAGGPMQAPIERISNELDPYFSRYRTEQHVPGLVYGIVAGGQLAYVQTFGSPTNDPQGVVTPDTLFRIASMSKAFTALAILKLRDEGRLRLDAPAEDYVPELRRWRYPTADSPRIRVRDLLSHVAGFVTDDPWGDRQQVLTEAEFTNILREGVPFTRAPQTAFEYSNFGYALLGRIITNVSGRPYQDYISEEIMRPLGMESSGYDISRSPVARRAIGYRWENDTYAREPDMRDGAFGAMGGVQTSARDYARWVAFLLSAWPARDGPETGPVRRSTVRELAQGLNFVA
ncbi:serine hydrolase domain-containing protein, partial [Sphingosinicella sp.]|uniref:serine hydrolase domain-containing protein n=1 Tax=Sphingosinicella sp. TaxID=1917971 RepID=UPI0040380AB9